MPDGCHRKQARACFLFIIIIEAILRPDNNTPGNTDLQLKRNMARFNFTAFAVDTKIQLDFGEIGIERLRRQR